MEYITVKQDGEYYPMRFITKNDEAGKYRQEDYKLEDGEEFVTVTFTEVWGLTRQLS